MPSGITEHHAQVGLLNIMPSGIAEYHAKCWWID